MQDYYNSILHFNAIMVDCMLAGQFHKEELKLMRSSCAFQGEIDSGSLKLFSSVIQQNSSSNFNKE